MLDRDKVVTFRMNSDVFLKLRRKLGLRQFTTGQYLSVSGLINALIARYLVEEEFQVEVDNAASGQDKSLQ